MNKHHQILLKILTGTSDANIGFSDLCKLLLHLGFQERTRGSHHIFYKDKIPEIIHLQPRGSNAKPYQVKQVRNIILKYQLAGDVDD